MLYTKYESSGPCSVGQEDFWKLHFEKLFLTPWPTYATNWNGLNNFDRRPPRDHSCEVWSKSNRRFQRRCCLNKLLTHARTTDAGHWRITKAKKLLTDGRTDGRHRTLKDHKSSLSTLCSGELKKVLILDVFEKNACLPPPARSSVRAVEGRQRTRYDRFETEAFIKVRRTCTYIYIYINKGYHAMKFEGSGSKGTRVIERKRISLFGSLWPWPLTYWPHNQ